MTANHEEATIFGMASALILTDIPSVWLTLGEKMACGAMLALLSGFMYAAGKYGWSALLTWWQKR